jgi:hypothetical protein
MAKNLLNIKDAHELHSAASRNQKERLALKLQITKYKLQTNYKSQITKEQLSCRAIEILLKRGFPGC